MPELQRRFTTPIVCKPLQMSFVLIRVSGRERRCKELRLDSRVRPDLGWLLRRIARNVRRNCRLDDLCAMRIRILVIEIASGDAEARQVISV